MGENEAINRGRGPLGNYPITTKFCYCFFSYTHNFLPSYEKIAQSKGNLAHPTECISALHLQEPEHKGWWSTAPKTSS